MMPLSTISIAVIDAVSAAKASGAAPRNFICASTSPIAQPVRQWRVADQGGAVKRRAVAGRLCVIHGQNSACEQRHAGEAAGEVDNFDDGDADASLGMEQYRSDCRWE